MPRSNISNEHLNEIFDLAKSVYIERLTRFDAVVQLENKFGIARGTADAYLGAALGFRSGTAFWRTISTYGVCVFLELTKNDSGLIGLKKAQMSINGHIRDHYLTKGRRSLKLSKSTSECFEKLGLHSSGESKFLEGKISKLSDEKIFKNLPKAGSRPSLRIVEVVQIVRNPYVVEYVLRRADGKCERCKKPAPFNRKSNGSPYLEVHHMMMLSDGGDDTADNAQALCPNCHRMQHHGYAT
jgi:5-methylcytosine-specific restriction protein A